jgi:glycosyltransferase involved in cell wall biosynthesis
MRRILALNSLDRRYGSTYRFRALVRLLRESGTHVGFAEAEAPAVRKLAGALRAANGRYDLLFTQKFNPITLAAILIARLRGRGVLVDWDDLDAGLQGGPGRAFLARLCEGIGPRVVHAITTHSLPIAERARRLGRPVFLVPQGFDPDLFRPDPVSRREARVRLGLSETERAIGHLCTLTHGGTLDLDVVFEAWAAVPDPSVRFVLIGGGPLEAAVRRRANSLGLGPRILWTGLLPQAEVAATLNALDAGVIFMSDRPGNLERVSFKVIEYLATGLPVVGRVVGETARLFGAHLFGCRGGDFADTIAAVLQDPPPRVAPPEIRSFAWTAARAPLVAAVERIERRAIECR